MSKAKFTRLIIATLLGSLTMFVWGGFSHLVSLTGTGASPLLNEAGLKAALHTNISEAGFYFFPGKDARNASKEQAIVFKDKLGDAPPGILGYKPVGGNSFSAGRLIIQFLSSVLSVLIAVQVVSLIRTGYWTRVIVVTNMGLLSCSAWYAFPAGFSVAQLLDTAIGFFLAGLVVCSVLQKTGD